MKDEFRVVDVDGAHLTVYVIGRGVCLDRGQAERLRDWLDEVLATPTERMTELTDSVQRRNERIHGNDAAVAEAREEDEMPKWLTTDDLSYRGGGVMSRRAIRLRAPRRRRLPITRLLKRLLRPRPVSDRKLWRRARRQWEWWRWGG